MTVDVHIDAHATTTPRGRSLFETAEELGVRVPTSCLGHGKCRECLVEVTAGMDLLSSPTGAEAHLEERFRLSCQARVTADTGTVRCQTLRRGSIRIDESFSGLPGIAGSPGLDPAVTRHGDRIFLDGVEIERSAAPIHGLAVDLGTTTVVLRLVDLDSGEVIAIQSFENPQRFGGSDVLARVKYDTDHGGQLLRRTLLGYMRHAIDELGINPRTIYEVTVAGNAAMRDIFFGLNVHSIGQRPYRSITEHDLLDGKRETTSLTLDGRRSHLPVHRRARVHGLPLITSHVGADAAATLLAIGIAEETRTVAMIDIGTNTEVVVGNRDRLLAASCPAGPAFEGGAISCGMPALDGAIERVRISADGAVDLTVIGGEPPRGICGSGLIDVLAELLRGGRMDRLGRLTDGSDRFVLDRQNDVFITEADISLLAQAKAANVCGLDLVLRSHGLAYDDLDVIYLAGSFARHLDLDAARSIGLIPDLPGERFLQIGNASLEGATRALVSMSARATLEQVVRSVQHVELETFEEFFDIFVEGVQFASFGPPGPPQ